MHLEGEGKWVLEASLGEASTKGGLTALEAELEGASGLLALVPSSSCLPFTRSNPSPFPPLLLPRPFVVPQIIQSKQATAAAAANRSHSHYHAAVALESMCPIKPPPDRLDLCR